VTQGEDFERYRAAADVIGRVTAAKARQLAHELGEIHELAWAEVQHWLLAAGATAQTVLGWSLSLITVRRVGRGTARSAGASSGQPPPTPGAGR
jgi:hypothetical protein